MFKDLRAKIASKNFTITKSTQYTNLFPAINILFRITIKRHFFKTIYVSQQKTNIF